MKKERSVEYKIDCTMESIRIIEEQIRDFEQNKPLFFHGKKLKEYNERIEKLESVKRYLYKRLEYKVDDN